MSYINLGTNHYGVCPTCGHCPTCGRGGHGQYYGQWPWWQTPITYGTVTSGGTPATIGDPTPPDYNTGQYASTVSINAPRVSGPAQHLFQWPD